MFSIELVQASDRRSFAGSFGSRVMSAFAIRTITHSRAACIGSND
jgi:hypothetical protein